MMSKSHVDTDATAGVERTVVATDPDREIDPELIDRLLEQAGDDRELLGEGGLLQQLTKQVLETAGHRADRSSRLREWRGGGPRVGQLTQRHVAQAGPH
jgi:hypothetical protein